MNYVDEEAVEPWQELERNLEISDSFRYLSPRKLIYTYSHTNKISRSRIDRAYLSRNLLTKLEKICYETSHFSDHKIMIIRMMEDFDRGEGHWILNNSLLNEEGYIEMVKNEIRESRSLMDVFDKKKDFFDNVKQNMQSKSRLYAIEKSKHRRIEKAELKAKREKIEKISRQRFTSIDINRLKMIEDREKEIEAEEIEGMKLRTKIPTFEFGEPSISHLSRLEKNSGEKNGIYSLKNVEGEVCEDSESILKTCKEYYEKLYTKEEEDLELQDFFLSGIDKRLSEEDRAMLDEPITEDELYKALKLLNKGKSPGHSGLTVEFYLKFWNDLKEYLTGSLEETKIDEVLSEMQKRGAIKISFKKDDRTNLDFYRPITLLEVDLKILAKVLSMRLNKVLSKLVNLEQKCVSGRHITDNIHVVQDIIDLINANDEEAAFLLFDMQKAFDRLSHTFLIRVLEGFGFGEGFIKWVKILLKDVKSFVRVL